MTPSVQKLFNGNRTTGSGVCSKLKILNALISPCVDDSAGWWLVLIECPTIYRLQNPESTREVCDCYYLLTIFKKAATPVVKPIIGTI